MSVRAAFAHQGQACAALGSPFMGRVMPLIGTRLRRGTAVAERILDWPGDPTASGDSVPLRLAGALHALKLEGLALRDVYPPKVVSDDTLWDALEACFETHEAQLLEWLDSPPQTNEVRRAAVLLPALSEVTHVTDKPISLLELGTSAGLNLRCDRFWLELPEGGLGDPGSPVQITPDWQGRLPRGSLPEIVARRGVDLNPLDPSCASDRLRLLAYLWPDQPDRIARTENAFRIAREVPADIAAGDAGEWLAGQLANASEHSVPVVFHTVAWQYFPEQTVAHALQAMATCRKPVLQIGMEADGGTGATVKLTVWPEGKSRMLGRASFHGLWVNWH